MLAASLGCASLVENLQPLTILIRVDLAPGEPFGEHFLRINAQSHADLGPA